MISDVLYVNMSQRNPYVNRRMRILASIYEELGCIYHLPPKYQDRFFYSLKAVSNDSLFFLDISARQCIY